MRTILPTLRPGRFGASGSILSLLLLSFGAAAAEPLAATVVKVVGNRAAIDAGSRNGVKPEAVFRLYSPVKIVRIPLTDTVTYQEEEPVATLVVSEVKAGESWGEVDVFAEGVEIKPGMAAVFSGYRKTVAQKSADVTLESDSRKAAPGQWVRVRAEGAPEGSIFRWKASSGWLSAGTSSEPAVFWAAPETPGKAEISLSVETPDGKTARASISLEVSASPPDIPEKFVQRTISGRLLASGAEPRVADVAVLGDTVYFIDARMAGLYSLGTVMGAAEIAGPNRGRLLRAPYALDTAGDKAFILDDDFYRIKCYSLTSGEQLMLMGKSAPVKDPVDLAAGPSGLLYVLDRGALKIHAVDISTGLYRLSFGRKGAEPGSFLDPAAVDTDASGRIYVLDAAKETVEVFDRAMALLGSHKIKPDAGNRLMDIAVDASGAFYVLQGPRTGIIKYDASGRILARSGKGVFPGLPREALRISCDPSGRLYVIPGNRAGIFRYGPDGEFLGAHALSGVRTPLGMAVAPDGSFALHYLDTPFVECFDPGGWRKAAWGEPFQKPVRFTIPGRLAFRPDAQALFAMGPGNLKAFYSIKPMHHVISFSVSGKILGYFGGAGQAYGRFVGQQDMAVDASGTVWVLDDQAFRVSAFGKDPNQPLVRNLVRGRREKHEVAVPTLLAVDPDGSSFYIFDEKLDTIKRFGRDGAVMSVLDVRTLRPRLAEAARITTLYKGVLAALDRARNAVYILDFNPAEPRLLSMVPLKRIDGRIKDIGTDAAGRILAVSDKGTVYVLSRY